MAGFSVTAVIKASTPPSVNMNYSRVEWVDEILKIPGPRVIVMKDLDHPFVIGSFWGEVQSAIHSSLNCVGVVTDGGVRDVETVHEIGFQMFSVGLVPAHGNFGLDETNVPVEVGGVLVNVGDVVHADMNGVVVFPMDLVDHVIAEAKKVTARESEMMDWVNSDEFSLDKFIEGR